MTKKRTKARPERARGTQSEKYHPSHAERVKMMIVELGAINNRGEVAWGRIAKLLGASVETLRRWRTPLSPYYKADFAAAATHAVEEIDARKIKRGLIAEAKPHVVVKRIRALRATGPKLPPKSWGKQDHLLFARLRLGVKLDPELSKVEIQMRIETECEERSTKKLVTVREERTGELNVVAAKLVLPNIGDPDKRWVAKESRSQEVEPKTIADIAAIMGLGDDHLALPCDEMMSIEPAADKRGDYVFFQKSAPAKRRERKKRDIRRGLSAKSIR